MPFLDVVADELREKLDVPVEEMSLPVAVTHMMSELMGLTTSAADGKPLSLPVF